MGATPRAFDAVCCARTFGMACASACLVALVACGDANIGLFPDEPPDAEVSESAVYDAPLEATPDEEVDNGPTCGSGASCPPETPRCEPALMVCVECVADSDCAGRTESKCNRVTDKCELPCSTDADCDPPDICDDRQGICADCRSDAECAGTREPRCLVEQCVECLSDADCAFDQHCWQHACVVCVTNADCPRDASCATTHVCN